VHQSRRGKKAVDCRNWIRHVEFPPPIGHGGVDGKQAITESFDERFEPLCQAVGRNSVTAADRLHSAAKFTGDEYARVKFAVDGLVEPATNPGISPRPFSKLRQNVGVEQPSHDEIFLGMSR
jgi:hypothetical protein